jgi:preprotein translocase subunit YajC
MISNIKQDEKVITIGGIYGTIVRIKDKSVILQVADNVRMEFLKTAISQVIHEEGDKGQQ